MNFGPIKLRQFPSGTNLSFKSKFQLFDNLWCVNNPQDKLKVANALMHYFRQINVHIDSKHFAFFVFVRGRQPGIYSQWKEVVDLMINLS